MMWPFREKPDTRPATAAAVAIAESLRKEPLRWKLHGDSYLKHDSGIFIGTFGFVNIPDLDDEPHANGELVAKAIDDWVAAQMKLPPKPPEPKAESTP